VKEAWEPIMPGLTMRDLRHTHDTYQAQIDVRPRLAFEQMGHKYPGIKGVYQHPTPEMRRQRLDGLQRIYERALGNLGWESTWES
jgi:integrase